MDRHKDGVQIGVIVNANGMEKQLAIYPSGQPITNAYWSSMRGEFTIEGSVHTIELTVHNMPRMKEGVVLDVDGRVVQEPEAIDATSSVKE